MSTRYSTDRHAGYRQRRAAGHLLQVATLGGIAVAATASIGWYLWHLLAPTFSTLTTVLPR